MIGLVVGIWVGAVVAILVRRSVNAPVAPELDLDAAPVVVPPEIENLVAVLHACAMVIGPHDEVMCANLTAVGSSLLRGARITEPELLDLVRQVRRTKQTVATALVVRRGRGQASVHYALRVAALGDDLIIALAEDQTEALRVEAVRRDFVANVSHELKTPIGAISLLAETIQDAADDPAMVRRFAGRMETESVRLTALVHQIIELSRLQAMDPLTEGEVVEVEEVLDEVVDRVKVEVANRKVVLRRVCDPGLTLIGNHAQISTAVSNLVENALQYSDSGANVVVSARRVVDGEESSVQIAVSDNGIGIAPEEQDRIFERFYRVAYARTRADGGTGLGLAIVKHVTAAHAGSIDVWSRPGEGSTFTITIPDHPRLTELTADQELTRYNQEVSL